ncbi:MAG: HNH endonuclease family protein [Caldimicrobium sp.]|nr:HNH endonuclease family protein [Caldimicrobium sp.]MCX7873020.1 HNH endonuclease family protein [Caldimicrobium sp.]
MNKLNEMEWSKVSTSLRKISNDDAKLLLFWVALYRRSKDDRYDEKKLKYEYELEHIMPIKWEELWGLDVVPHPNNSHSPEEQKRDRNEKVRWIGNMTLLKSSLNNEIKNNRFDIKMEGKGQKKGIKHYATLSITRDEIVEPYEKGDKVWNESKIEERTKKSEREIEEIWGR